jgi:hypothetical protein
MKTLLLLLLVFLSSSSLFAQDYILNKKGEEVQAKVLEITLTEVKYKKFDNLEGPVITLARNDVMMIKYENGSKEVFAAEKPAAPVASPVEMYAKGQQDAFQYYKGSGPMWGTYVPTIVFAPAGLVAGAVIGATSPKVDPFRIPDRALLEEPAYVQGYKKQAGRRKWGKVATGFGLGVLTNIVVYSLVNNNK